MTRTSFLSSNPSEYYNSNSNNNSSSMTLSSSSSSYALRRTAVVAVVWGMILLVATTQLALVDGGAVLGEQRIEKENFHSRSLAVENLSGRKTDMFWVNTFKTPEEFVPQFVEDGVSVGLPYGGDKSISSYQGHTFEIRELPSKRTGSCVYQECRKVRYTMTDRREQKIVLERDFTLTVKDDKERAYTKIDGMFSKCQEQLSETTNPLDSIEAITQCMEAELKGKVTEDRKERSFHSKIHRNMAAELVPFICANVNETQSLEIKNTTWTYNDDDEEEDDHVDYENLSEGEHLVRTLHRLPTSEIFVVENFVDQPTCNALKLYQKKSKTNRNLVGVPIKAAREDTKPGALLLEVYYKLYAVLMDHFPDWKELDFKGEFLFEYWRDTVGFDTPSQLCTTQEEVDQVVQQVQANQPKSCLIPGGVPEAAPTKHVVVEEGLTRKQKNKRRQLAQLFLFCDDPEPNLGGLHFPYASVHVTPQKGKLVVAVHRHVDDDFHEFDGYANEYHLCPNHEVFVHTVFDHDPPDYVPPPPPGDDEGEL